MKKNEESEYKYIIFPLPLLQEIFKKPKTGFNDIFYFGIYKTALAQNVNEDHNAVKQALYCFYRGGLTPYLEKRFDELIRNEVFSPDEDYNGFSCDEFGPYNEMDDINEYLKTDSDLLESLIEFHKLRQIKKVLNLEFDIQTAINTYNQYSEEYSGFKNMPLVMIKTTTMIEYSNKSKSEFEKVLFATFAGIKSLMGRGNDLLETTQNMIFYRMVGAKNKEALTEILKDKKVKSIYNKYSVRYQRDKILNHLVAKNFLMSKLGYNKRMYLSFTLKFEDLPEAISVRFKEKNINLKIKSNKIKELQARKDISRHLNK